VKEYQLWNCFSLSKAARVSRQDGGAARAPQIALATPGVPELHRWQYSGAASMALSKLLQSWITSSAATARRNALALGYHAGELCFGEAGAGSLLRPSASQRLTMKD
jgi:hypothetical protein